MEVVTNVTTQTKQDLFLYNANPDGNPIVTALVQTPRIIDYKDVGEGKWKYKEESIRNAITDLIGYQVEDEQHKGTGDKSFATITNAGYCPKYNGGYVEMEVFKPEYHDLMRNIAENMEKGIAPKKGFSTEVLVKKAIPEGDHYDITDMKYNSTERESEHANNWTLRNQPRTWTGRNGFRLRGQRSPLWTIGGRQGSAARDAF